MKHFNLLKTAFFALILISGTLNALAQSKAKLQIIHNSPDTLIRKVDIYANGTKVVNDLGFRGSSSILELDAFVDTRIHITKFDAADTTTSLWSTTLSLDSVFNVAIAYGFTSTPYRANPENISTSFDVKLITKAKVLSSFPEPTNEILFFHGSPNLVKVDIQAFFEPLFVAKGNSYGTVYKYSPAKGGIGSTYNINNATDGKGLYSSAMNFTKRKGLAGIMFASGIMLDRRFSSRDTVVKNTAGRDTTIKILTAFNKADSILSTIDSSLNLGFYIAWSNGEVDSFENFSYRTSIQEAKLKNGSFNVYPNPASQKVTFLLNTLNKFEANIKLFDTKGVLLKEMNKTMLNGTNEIEMNISELPKGIYFVNIDGSQYSFNQKLIIE